jgi:hypothetical protein
MPEVRIKLDKMGLELTSFLRKACSILLLNDILWKSRDVLFLMDIYLTLNRAAI